MNNTKGFIAAYSTTDNDVVKRFDTLEELKAFKPVFCELKSIIDLSKSVNLLDKIKGE